MKTLCQDAWRVSAMKARCIIFCSTLPGNGEDRYIVRKHTDSVEISMFIEDSLSLPAGCHYAVVFTESATESFIIDESTVFRNVLFLVSQERFWEAHEALEDLWRISEQPRKGMLQALIWVLAAQVHWQMDQPDTAIRMHKRAMKALEYNMEFKYPISEKDVSYIIGKISAPRK